MDNDLLKNIIEQFPSAALFIACVGSIIWLVKSLLEIRNSNYSSRINKEILSITLSSVKSQELIDNLLKLQEMISDFEKLSEKISDKIYYKEIELISKNLDDLIKKLPDNWKFKRELILNQDWLSSFLSINESIGEITNVNKTTNEKDFLVSKDKLTKETSHIFFAIDDLIKLTTKYKDKADSTINWVATAKGAIALSFLIFFSFSLVFTTNLQQNLDKSLAAIKTNTEEYKAKIQEIEQNKAQTETKLAESNAKIEELYKKLEDNTTMPATPIIPIQPNNKESDLIIKLNWDTPTDLDLMLKLPNKEIISYQKINTNDGNGELLSDILSGPAQEEIILKKPSKGIYEITVTNYRKEGLVEFKVQQNLGTNTMWKEDGIVGKNSKTYKIEIK